MWRSPCSMEQQQAGINIWTLFSTFWTQILRTWLKFERGYHNQKHAMLVENLGLKLPISCKMRLAMHWGLRAPVSPGKTSIWSWQEMTVSTRNLGVVPITPSSYKLLCATSRKHPVILASNKNDEYSLGAWVSDGMVMNFTCLNFYAAVMLPNL